jgi:hypothetical protein
VCAIPQACKRVHATAWGRTGITRLGRSPCIQPWTTGANIARNRVGKPCPDGQTGEVPVRRPYSQVTPCTYKHTRGATQAQVVLYCYKALWASCKLQRPQRQSERQSHNQSVPNAQIPPKTAPPDWRHSLTRQLCEQAAASPKYDPTNSSLCRRVFRTTMAANCVSGRQQGLLETGHTRCETAQATRHMSIAQRKAQQGLSSNTRCEHSTWNNGQGRMPPRRTRSLHPLSNIPCIGGRSAQKRLPMI